MVYASYATYEICVNELKKAYASNAEKFRERTRLWNKNHPEKKKAWDKRYRESHRIENKEYQEKYRNNPEKRKHLLEQKREYHKKLMSTYSPLLEKWKIELKKNFDSLKWQVLIHYSPKGSTEPKCSCPNCPEILPFFMSLDHINGGGSKHRKITGTGRTYYKWFVNNNYPEGYRTLCHNCNHAREYMPDKKCPHELIDSNTNPFTEPSGMIDPTSLKDNPIIISH